MKTPKHIKLKNKFLPLLFLIILSSCAHESRIYSPISLPKLHLKTELPYIEPSTQLVKMDLYSAFLNKDTQKETTEINETYQTIEIKELTRDLSQISNKNEKDKIKNKLSAKLVNINPNINRWLILTTPQKDNKAPKIFHLENVIPSNKISLHKDGLIIKNSLTGEKRICKLWNKEHDIRTTNFGQYRNPYFPLCAGLVYLRLKRSSNTKLSLTEWATEKLRKISFGENIINFVKPLVVASKAEAAVDRFVNFLENKKLLHSAIKEAAILPVYGKIPVPTNHNLGISIDNQDQFIQYGKWYPTKMHPGIYVSLMIPGLVDKEILKSFKGKISKKEEDKLIYLVGYDLDKYSVNFVHGTTYPGLGNVKALNHNKISQSNNLTLAGTVPPYMADHTVGVFIGGYKRSHGFFKYGVHQGKTYGYIEKGVVLSKMQSNLATLISTRDGKVDIIRWPSDKAQEKELLKKIVSARQNGTFILENNKPGKYIYSWGNGNWSGDVNGNLMTLRSAVCIQNENNKKHLLFAAFTGATPVTMAKVLKSYSCEKAMQLDMNAFMYLHNAIFKFDDNNKINIEYLHTEMEYPKGLTHHRFILDNNNRDFFYIFKKHHKIKTLANIK